MNWLSKVREAFSHMKKSEDDVIQRIEKLERCHREIGHDIGSAQMRIGALQRMIEAMPAGKDELLEMMDDAMGDVDKRWGKKR